MQPSQSFYSILGLQNFASLMEVKQAFKKLAILYHPDKNPNNLEAEENFKKINAVYQILGNPQKKELYDHYLIQGINQTPIYGTQQQVYRTRHKIKKDENLQATFFAILFVLYVFFVLDAVNKVRSRIHFAYADHFYEQKQYKSSLEHLNSCLGSDKTYARAHYLSGKIDLENLKHYKAAAESFEKAIEYTEIIPLDYFLKRGIAYSYLQQTDKTAEDFAKVYSQIGKADNSLLLQMADAYFEATDFENAMNFYKKLDSLGFANKEIYLKKSFIEKNNGNYLRAAEHLSKAIELDSFQANLYYERALLYLQIGEIEKTCTDWQKAQSLNYFLKDASLDFFCNVDSTKN